MTTKSLAGASLANLRDALLTGNDKVIEDALGTTLRVAGHSAGHVVVGQRVFDSSAVPVSRAAAPTAAPAA